METHSSPNVRYDNHTREPGLESRPTLLSLPAELRNAIYAFAVTSDAPIPIFPFCATTQQYTETWRVNPKPPALASVCKQLREEVLPIYYTTNAFQLVTNENQTRAIYAGKLTKWRRFLGIWAEKIRCLQLTVTYNVFVHGNGTTRSFFEERRCPIELATCPRKGMSARRWDVGQCNMCACTLLQGLQKRGVEKVDAGLLVGEALFEFAEKCVKDEALKEVVRCEECALFRLVNTLA
jgi:hypothetical protein